MKNPIPLQAEAFTGDLRLERHLDQQLQSTNDFASDGYRVEAAFAAMTCALAVRQQPESPPGQQVPSLPGF